ncbi:MAG: glycoside hydrolase [Winogradskyella sp.]|uniref:glycoside hydrolase family 113 n=1 Tax=Winogradskyella sp. TaxID=1883156 RepID=UPI000F3C183E|nr:glycoside hydrolase [Winogradskyella sp.]RNC84160.1 MAG: glycoside hydrolase [Winogradskyella sp.]
MKIFKCLFLVVFLSSCVGQENKINGVSFVAAPDAVTSSNVKPVVAIHANYATVMPFGFIRNLEHPDIIHNTERQWFGETRDGTKQYIEELRKASIKIMIKPQIWVWRGEFTGNIKMTSEESWKNLEASYTSFIMEYAELANEVNAELFCIGTELELFVKHRPQYWTKLIKNIKTKYKGKLTYAANWNEYEKTPFWGQLDYIGIDAYFPVSDKKTPSVEDCINGWQKHKKIIAGLSDKVKKPVLFAEFGYRSVDYTGKEPWRYDRNIGEVNLQAQVNATKALFDVFWNEDWFAGGFVWKWFIKHDKSGGKDNRMFTPQNKPVENTIKEHYKSFNE